MVKKTVSVKRDNLKFRKKKDQVLKILPSILIIVLTVSYFLFAARPLFFYQENISLFIYSGSYLGKFSAKPGGLLEYAGYFLTQFYFNPIAGTVIIATVLCLLLYIFTRIGEKLAPDNLLMPFLSLVPSCLLLLSQTRYDHLMHINLGFLVVSALFLAAISIEKRINRAFIIVFLPVLIYLTGSFALVFAAVFIIYCLVYEKGAEKFILPVLMAFVYIVTFFIFRNLVFYQPADSFFNYPFPVTGLTKISRLLLLFTVFFILFPLIIRYSPSYIKAEKIKYSQNLKSGLFLSGFIITGFALWFLHDTQLTLLMKLEEKVIKQDWDGVISQQEKKPSTNIIGQYYYNLALSEKGILCDRLFFGRQDFGSKSLCLPRDNEHYNRVVYFYYNIGLINEARHLAYESMVGYGLRPESIKLLIKTELLNGNFRMAEKYINILKKTLHYGRLASHFEKMLYNPSMIMSDPELGEKMKQMPGIDFFVRSDNRENVNLLWLANRDNRKAFEYRLAWMLLDKDLNSVVSEVINMNEMGYNRIPQYIQEAVVGYINLTGKLPDLGGLRLDPGTEQRFNNYGSVYVRYENDKKILEREIRKAGGNTLWYYMEFR